MSLENKNSVFPDSTIRNIEIDYQEYRNKYKTLTFKRDNETVQEFSYPYKYAIQLAKNANITGTFYNTSHRRYLGFLTTGIKKFIQKIMVPFIKITFVHQQNFNNQVVSLAQAVVHLEQRLYQLEERLLRQQKKVENQKDTH